MAEGIQLRLTHAQRVLPSPPYEANTLRRSSIYIDDLRETENQRGLRLQPHYVPFETAANSGIPGFVDLDFTSLVARSFENGDIRTLIDTGEVTFEFFVGGELQRAANGTVLITSVAGGASPDVYNANDDESLFLVDTTNDAVTINLPSGLTHGFKRVQIVDIGQNSNANNITLVAYNDAGPPLDVDTIGGGANYVLATDGIDEEFHYLDAGIKDWRRVLGPGTSPTGAAGGDLGGNYPNPSVAAITETAGPTQLVIGAIGNGQYLQRAGATVIGVAAPGGISLQAATFPGPFNAANTDFVQADASGGPFTVNLPNPGVAGDRIIVKKIDATANVVTIDSNGGPNIDAAATVALNVQYESKTIVRGTAQWWVE